MNWEDEDGGETLICFLRSSTPNGSSGFGGGKKGGHGDKRAEREREKISISC